MNLISNPFDKHTKLLMVLCFVIIVFGIGMFLIPKSDQLQLSDVKKEPDVAFSEYESMINVTELGPKKTRRKEYLYKLLTNTTRSLIQMEIKARRLEENMRRIKEKTADLLWNNKDKALWHILFKNISRHISIRHEFHQHSSLRRIMKDSQGHKHNRKFEKRKVFLRR